MAHVVTRRICLPLAAVPDYERAGWRVMWLLPQPMRGTDVLMEWTCP